MGDSTKKNSSFIMQGLFLALASVISRIIGLIYRVPLTNIIGKTGNDNYGTAYEIYNVLLIISSYSLPLAISKMIAARMAEKRVVDARRVFRLGIIFALISGTVAFLIVFLGADFFAGEVLKTPYAAVALKALSPALIIVAIMGVLRGFFQGLGSMVPTAISQVLEQIVNAVVSVAAAYALFNFGLGMSVDYAAAYGAAGGTLGTVAGALVGLGFMAFVCYAYSRTFKRKVSHDSTGSRETVQRSLGILVMTIVPVLLSTTLYNISSIVDQGIYKNIALDQGLSALFVSERWGEFTGQYRVLINIPVAIASALAASVVPSLTASHRKRSGREVRSKINMGMRFIMIVSFPCMVGFMVLAKPIMMLLFNDIGEHSTNMLILGAASVVFYAISTFSNAVLQGIDRMGKPVVHALISLILQAGILVLFLKLFNMHIYAVIIANIFYALLMTILNGVSVRKFTRVKYDIKKTFVLPLICSVIMGAGVYLVYWLIEHFSGKGAIGTVVSIIVGMLLYFVLLIKLKALGEQELSAMPKGRIFVKIAKKLRLI